MELTSSKLHQIGEVAERELANARLREFAAIASNRCDELPLALDRASELARRLRREARSGAAAQPGAVPSAEGRATAPIARRNDRRRSLRRRRRVPVYRGLSTVPEPTSQFPRVCMGQIRRICRILRKPTISDGQLLPPGAIGRANAPLEPFWTDRGALVT